MKRSAVVEKSEALLNSRLQRLSSKVHKFCMAHGLPRVHGCVWDKHCRWASVGLRRVDLVWGRHSVWVDLPGYDKAMTRYRGPLGDKSDPEHIPASWQLLPQFGRYSRPKGG